MVTMLTEIDSWRETYKGWALEFDVEARGDDGAMKAEVGVKKSTLFGFIAYGLKKYEDTGDEWVMDEEEVEEQIWELRKGAQDFIDRVEAARGAKYHG